MGRPKNNFCTNGHDMSLTRKYHPNGDSYCSKCKSDRTKIYQKEHKEQYSIYRRKCFLKKQYGVSPDFTEGKPCAICGTMEFGKRRAHVDHDHETGEVRGVLCHSCNTGLGLLGSNLEAAILYLRAAGKSKAKKKK